MHCCDDRVRGRKALTWRWSLAESYKYEALDLNAAGSALSTLGLAAIEHALTGSPRLEISWQEIASLEPFVLPIEINGRRRRRAEYEIQRSLRLTEAPNSLSGFDLLVGDLMQDRHTLANLKDWLTSPWEVRGEGPAEAHRVLLMVSVAVWEDPRFCAMVAQRIRETLMHRVLFHPSSSPIAVLHPYTLWLLLAALDFRSIRAPTRKRGTRFAHTLQQSAINIGLQREWAGLWDQWILAELVIRHRQPVPSALENAVRSLPIARWPVYGESQEPETDVDTEPDGKSADAKPVDEKMAFLVKPSWDVNAPAWMRHLAQGVI